MKIEVYYGSAVSKGKNEEGKWMQDMGKNISVSSEVILFLLQIKADMNHADDPRRKR